MSKAFTTLIDRILERHPEFLALRAAVEKEVLHYEIFRALAEKRLLNEITFQGGTALRLCYGSDRLSEDIDFAGGRGFAQTDARAIKACVEGHLFRVYDLEARVKEPEFSVFEDGSAEGVAVGKWSISIRTSDNVADPQQRIKLEIATVPAYTRMIAALRANYEHIQPQTTPLVPVESREEILADKALAFPMSLKILDTGEVDLASARIRHRDIWDMAALQRSGVRLDPELVFKKVEDYSVSRDEYVKRLDTAIASIDKIVRSPLFANQIGRFVAGHRLAEYLDPKARESLLIDPARGLLGTVSAGDRSQDRRAAPPRGFRAARRGRDKDDMERQ
ncbi:putative uncharacterized protein [Burkholderiales bacterium GJ-E10]|nr:putative uncharacterized protein [Burkholderiales bacterium GJ-E10]